MRPVIDAFLRTIGSRLSEYSFGTLYLFRKKYKYRAGWLGQKCLLITGDDKGQHGGGEGKGEFFMLLGDLPTQEKLDEIFSSYCSMKSVSEEQAEELKERGYEVSVDRDNFDYLYLRSELADYPAGKYRKKRALVRAFTDNNTHETSPLTNDRVQDALVVLEAWQAGQEGQIEAGEVEAATEESVSQYAVEQSGVNDYLSAKEALEKISVLGLTGIVVYVGDEPVAYCLGEELEQETFVIHYEKGVLGFKGLKQFVVQAFAKTLPEKYKYINREQDLGLPGLREAKIGLRPTEFVRQYRATRK
jgi:hypothetical protein